MANNILRQAQEQLERESALELKTANMLALVQAARQHNERYGKPTRLSKEGSDAIREGNRRRWKRWREEQGRKAPVPRRCQHEQH